MTREDTGKILAIVTSTYPRHFEKQGVDDMNAMLISWTHVLADYDYRTAEAGLLAYMANDTNGFPPSPGQIVEYIHKASPSQEMTAEEAWALVTKAIRNSNYNAKEEFEKLPKLAQKAIGAHVNLETMAGMPSDTVHSVAKSNFLRAYNSMVEREKVADKIPERVKNLIAKTSQKMLEVAT